MDARLYPLLVRAFIPRAAWLKYAGLGAMGVTRGGGAVARPACVRSCHELRMTHVGPLGCAGAICVPRMRPRLPLSCLHKQNETRVLGGGSRRGSGKQGGANAAQRCAPNDGWLVRSFDDFALDVSR